MQHFHPLDMMATLAAKIMLTNARTNKQTNIAAAEVCEPPRRRQHCVNSRWAEEPTQALHTFIVRPSQPALSLPLHPLA